MNDRDKEAVVPIAKDLAELGFKLVATSGTQATLVEAGLSVEPVLKIHEGRPNIEDAIKTW
jgi:carbamoyl-phosphate synthase large subunit